MKQSLRNKNLFVSVKLIHQFLNNQYLSLFGDSWLFDIVLYANVVDQGGCMDSSFVPFLSLSCQVFRIIFCRKSPILGKIRPKTMLAIKCICIRSRTCYGVLPGRSTQKQSHLEILSFNFWCIVLLVRDELVEH